jgi:hypothetical protein
MTCSICEKAGHGCAVWLCDGRRAVTACCHDRSRRADFVHSNDYVHSNPQALSFDGGDAIGPVAAGDG